MLVQLLQKTTEATLEAVQMDKLPMDVHMVWMKVMKELNCRY
jgi:hypothetical protein